MNFELEGFKSSQSVSALLHIMSFSQFSFPTPFCVTEWRIADNYLNGTFGNRHSEQPIGAGASPQNFVWEDGFMGTQTHLPPKFSSSSDFEKMQNFHPRQEKKMLKYHHFWGGGGCPPLIFRRVPPFPPLSTSMHRRYSLLVGISARQIELQLAILHDPSSMSIINVTGKTCVCRLIIISGLHKAK